MAHAQTAKFDARQFFSRIPKGFRFKARQRCLLGKVFLDVFDGVNVFGWWRLSEYFELGIHMDNQSAPDSRRGNFARLVPLTEACVRCLAHGIAANGTER